MKKETRENSKKCECEKITDLEPIVYNVESVPSDFVKGKIARNHCLQVCKSWFDMENKELKIEHMINANTSVIKTYSFDDVAAEFGWKGFKFSDNLQTIFPIHFKM